jgi:hypothetical protein
MSQTLSEFSFGFVDGHDATQFLSSQKVVVPEQASQTLSAFAFGLMDMM